MKIIAGLDIRNNKCIHLVQGNLETSKAHVDPPVDIVKKLDEIGIDQFHIVDIDGIFSGQSNMFDLLKELRRATDKPIQFGGGIRDFETAEKIFNLGIDEIVLGTLAIKNQELLMDLLDKYPTRIVVAADVYKGYVYIEGWEENSSITIEQFLKTLELIHVNKIMITDISKDGTASGVNHEFVDEILGYSNADIILSGGINSNEEIQALRSKSLYGAVISTALYEGLITIK
ncbi:MAG: 1-(5-phosphoribosyl)-5-[(5-phosphoribosylamino)methylideneamino] imidazole-4-carboxamide isomerase [Clostridiales bacterium]|nr:1-(5-phosphoribosyl)-5-[(5-phosphoribosylamino)methylideneamino] imidazole-4-carboxamide isomerase [Clostridiales bacterium]